jgi:hypothetical protein
MPEEESTIQNGVVAIKRIASETIYVPLIGTSPLIVSKFSQKAKRQMLDAQQGRKSPREARNPQAEYEASKYEGKDDGGNTIYGFPASGFKNATVSAARFYGRDVKMTELRQFIFVRGRYFPEEKQQFAVIEGTPNMREDCVRLAGAGRPADLRYRAEFTPWRAILVVTYVASLLSKDSVLSLIDAAGMGVGIGEWRPEHKGEFGTFQIDEKRDPADILVNVKACYGDANG